MIEHLATLSSSSRLLLESASTREPSLPSPLASISASVLLTRSRIGLHLADQGLDAEHRRLQRHKVRL